MKIRIKYRPVSISYRRINDNKEIVLDVGSTNEMSTEDYDRVFDTKEEAIKCAYKNNSFGGWTIFEVISFEE